MRRLSADCRPAVKIALLPFAVMLQRMIVGRLIGWLFLLAGLAVFARDLMRAAASQVWQPIALVQLWQETAPRALAAAQSAVGRYISVYAWQVASTLLTVWAFAALIVIGVALLVAFRRRRDVIQ